MLPRHLKKNIGQWKELHEMKMLLRNKSLHTVCESARCPNICECFSRGVATFMILGDKCTRSCGFCAVKKIKKRDGADHKPDRGSDVLEPERVAIMAKELGLKHVVITSVTRDDLSDGGASAFAGTIGAIKSLGLNMKVEVLTPDFMGDGDSIKLVVKARPDIFAHNLETVPRLYPSVRKEADYERSLDLLAYVKRCDSNMITKSGVMVGLGETQGELIEVMEDLRKVGCDSICIGHYLQPTKENLEVKEFIAPELFKYYEEKGYEFGFRYVVSGPFVRSSYLSDKVFEETHRIINV